MSATNRNRFDTAPRAVQRRISAAMFDYSLIALAVHRGDDATAKRYGDALEAAAKELEAAIAEGNGWIRSMLG